MNKKTPINETEVQKSLSSLVISKLVKEFLSDFGSLKNFIMNIKYLIQLIKKLLTSSSQSQIQLWDFIFSFIGRLLDHLRAKKSESGIFNFSNLWQSFYTSFQRQYKVNSDQDLIGEPLMVGATESNLEVALDDLETALENWQNEN